MDSCNPILQKSCIMVTLVLNDRPCGQDRLWILRLMRQTVAQELERLEVLTYADIQKADCCQNLCIFWREFQTFKVDFDRTLVVLLDLEHATELYVGVLMLMDHIGLREV